MVDFVGRDIADVEHYAALGDGVLSPCGCCPSVPVSLLTRGTPLKKNNLFISSVNDRLLSVYSHLNANRSPF